MNTKDLLIEAIELLKEEKNTDAATKVSLANKADVDNEFEAVADKLYSDLLIENEEVAFKFKNLFNKYTEKETASVDKISNENGAPVIKWIVITLIVITVLYVLGTLLSADNVGI